MGITDHRDDYKMPGKKIQPARRDFLPIKTSVFRFR